jgi:hypothetical protein
VSGIVAGGLFVALGRGLQVEKTRQNQTRMM